jgi:hypothetical protein
LSLTTILSIVLNYDLILIYLNDAGPVIGKHLVVNLVDDAFILKPGKIVYLIQMMRIDQLTGFVNQLDLDIGGQMAPKRSSVEVQHGLSNLELFIYLFVIHKCVLGMYDYFRPPV